jgi:hypothetical protein
LSSRFRNELTIVPPVRIRVNHNGLATTIDWAATGSRRSVPNSSPALAVVGHLDRSGPLSTDRYLIQGTRKDYGGGDVSSMTSLGLSEFKALLAATRERQKEIISDVRAAKWQLVCALAGKALAWGSLAAMVYRPLRMKTENAVAQRRSDIATLKENLTASRISVSFDMESAVADPYRRMLSAFDSMARCQRAWNVRTEQQIDYVKARSYARAVISRAKAGLARDAASLVDTADQPLALTIQSGKAVAYFYPGFVLVVSGHNSEFAVIDMKELSVDHVAVRFTETEVVPTDATLVGKAWAKSNKDGSRDKRFKDNRQLPVLMYGQMRLGGPGGLNEVFMFSREGPCREFVAAVADLKRLLLSGSTERAVNCDRRDISQER